MNIYWELACAIKQVRIDSMANTESYITFLQLLYVWSVCFLLRLSTIFRISFVLILVVIVFQFFKACYSVKKYTCVDKHTIFDDGTKK